jgi:ribonuclease-3
LTANARAEAVTALVARLGHVFQDPALLERALTHASVGEGADKAAGRPARHNERLEFLGDRVLGLLVAQRLHGDFPAADEGELSSRLHALVDRQACGRVGERLGVGMALRLSPGETRTGGRRKEGVVADAVEECYELLALEHGLGSKMATMNDEELCTEEFAALKPFREMMLQLLWLKVRPEELIILLV